MKIKYVLIILATFLFVNHGIVFANGRSVGVSESDALTSCKCIDKNGNEYMMNEVSLITNEQGRFRGLPAKNGLASAKLSLYRLEYIEFTGNEAGNYKEGFAKAKVKFKQGNNEKKYEIFVGIPDDPLRLKGLDEDSVEIHIKLIDCKKIFFLDYTEFDNEKSLLPPPGAFGPVN